ncbi:MAG: hypothetical protein WBE13_13845 [Candidatus Acidiferrum sp.]
MKRFILTLSQFGSLLLTAFGGFYSRIAPPEDSLKFWPGYASLVTGVAFILIANVKNNVRSVILWISIVPAIVCPALYYVKYQSLTATYSESQVICGTVYTAKGVDYTSKNPGKTREELIRDFAGQTAEIWTEDSISRARVVLGLSYSAAIASLAFAVLTGLQNAKPPKGT